jgi:hypothetical protein
MEDVRKIQDTYDDTRKNICLTLEISFEVRVKCLLDIPGTISDATKEIFQSKVRSRRIEYV